MIERKDYTLSEWFDEIKDQFDINRPIEYRIKGHAIVCDGWQVVGGIKEYHMNYGWANGKNTWYSLDTLHYPDSTGVVDDEYMMINIKPDPAIGGSFSGSYSRDLPFPRRYFTRDATCASTATFAIGQKLQFLPHVEVKCDGDGYVYFNGSGVSSEYHEQLFSISSKDAGAKILIQDGAVKLYGGGGIRFHGE